MSTESLESLIMIIAFLTALIYCGIICLIAWGFNAVVPAGAAQRGHGRSAKSGDGGSSCAGLAFLALLVDGGVEILAVQHDVLRRHASEYAALADRVEIA